MLKKILYGIPRPLVLASFLLTLLWGYMNSQLTVALSKVTATKIEQQEFFYAACYFVGFILIWELLEFVVDNLMELQNAYVRNESYHWYYEKIYCTKPDVLQKENTGYIGGILTQLIERKCALLLSILLLTISTFYIIYLIIYIARYSLWFSLIILGVTVIGIVIRLICSKMIETSLKDMTEARGNQNRIFMDGINNASTVQKLRGLTFLEKKASVYAGQNLHASLRYSIGNEIGFTLYKAINYLVCPICMFLALYLYRTNPDFPIVEFMAYLSVVTVQLVHNGRNIAGFIKDYGLFAASQKELDRLVAEESKVYTSTSIGNHFNELSLRNVSYQYNTQAEAVTINIDHFAIHKGEKICITGESGQGKTTLLKLLSGMIETNGQLYLDDFPCTQNIDAVYIAQDTEMLDMTLRENLTFGNENLTDEQLISMLNAVGMKEWFDKQEQGLDTLLGERGVFVSTGQRQRLNLIRGLLIQKEIYLLDEPTSNVDDTTEEKMIDLICNRLAGKTVIIVTHREKISAICDRHYTFSDNKLTLQ